MAPIQNAISNIASSNSPTIKCFCRRYSHLNYNVEQKRC